jgi:hypothetical protein
MYGTLSLSANKDLSHGPCDTRQIVINITGPQRGLYGIGVRIRINPTRKPKGSTLSDYTCIVISKVCTRDSSLQQVTFMLRLDSVLSSNGLLHHGGPLCESMVRNLLRKQGLLDVRECLYDLVLLRLFQ